MSSGLNIINADSKIDIVQDNLGALHTLTINSIDNLGSELDRRYTKTDTDILEKGYLIFNTSNKLFLQYRNKF